MSRILLTICVSLLLVSSTYAADKVIGNWETGTGDGWNTWNADGGSNGSLLIGTLPLSGAVTYSSSTIGATLGSSSLHIAQSGWLQSFAVSLSGADFTSHNTFSIDMTVAANDGSIAGGYTQIAGIWMNAATTGWTSISATLINFYWWPGSGQRTLTQTVDYSAYRAANASSGWGQIIIAFNTGGGAPPDFYLDNAKLTGIPEPATMAMLGLGGLALIRRKR
jgi:hypothetical protein